MRGPILSLCIVVILIITIITLTAPTVASNGDPKAGQAIYQRLCLPCHGRTGQGDGPIGISLSPRPKNLPEELHEEGAEFFFEVIQKGGRAMGQSPCMPAWANQLNPDDIWDVISHIRVLAEQL